MRSAPKLAALAAIMGVFTGTTALADRDGWQGPGWYVVTAFGGNKIVLLDGPVTETDCESIRSDMAATGRGDGVKCVEYRSKPRNLLR